jgi:hypothetical protein
MSMIKRWFEQRNSRNVRGDESSAEVTKHVPGGDVTITYFPRSAFLTIEEQCQVAKETRQAVAASK